jgi:ABC-type multidrug transport system fused ATPase/permease subunit
MIMVAHRLATVRMADRIYVLDQGRIVQSGSWDELLADSLGQFAQMASKQGFLAEASGALRGAGRN